MRPQSKSALHYGWVILVLATLVAFGALGLARFGYSIVLPAMQVDLGMDNTQAGVLAAIHVVGYLIASLLGGVLAARIRSPPGHCARSGTGWIQYDPDRIGRRIYRSRVLAWLGRGW